MRTSRNTSSLVVCGTKTLSMIFDLGNSSYLGKHCHVRELSSHRKVRQDVAKLFEPSVQEIIAAFEQQRLAASMPISVSPSPLSYQVIIHQYE